MNEAAYIAGYQGESIIRSLLKKKGKLYFQADLLVANDCKWTLLEIKHQEIFEPPPFYGHGLPPWQVEARMKFYEDTEIRVAFVVVDKKKKKIYWQYLDKLVSGESHTTTGKSKRIIFPITCFKEWRPPNARSSVQVD